MKSSNSSASLTLREIAAAVGGTVEGDADITITGAAAIRTAKKGEISFVANQKYVKYLETSRASAVVVDPRTHCPRLSVLHHPNPYFAFAQIVDLLYPETPHVSPGVHESAVMEDDVSLGADVAIGPLCHVRGGTALGRGTQLVSSVFIGRNVTVGDNCLLYPGVRIMDDCRIGNNVIIHAATVIGSDGFGFAESDAGLKKIKQIGWVEIDDDVEIGANCAVDRGALGPTRIGRGTKIDNLVQIAHNVEIGHSCIIVSQVGISGSTKIGNGVVLAGQVGIIGHLDIGDGVRVAAQSGVTKSIPAGKTMFGSPARDITRTKRIEASLTKLPELLRRVKKIEQKLLE